MNKGKFKTKKDHAVASASESRKVLSRAETAFWTIFFTGCGGFFLSTLLMVILE